MSTAAWREANADKMRQYRRDWYARNRGHASSKATANRKRYVERNMAITRAARDRPCADCAQRYPYYVMQFDHLGDDKLDNIATLANVPVSVEKLQAEMAKCEVVCANCHMARTHQRRVAAGEDEHPADVG